MDFYSKRKNSFRFVLNLLLPFALYIIIYKVFIGIEILDLDTSILTHIPYSLAGISYDLFYVSVSIAVSILLWSISRTWIFGVLVFFISQLLFVFANAVNYSFSQHYTDGAVSFAMLFDYAKDFSALAHTGTAIFSRPAILILVVLPLNMLLVVTYYLIQKPTKLSFRPLNAFVLVVFCMIGFLIGGNILQQDAPAILQTNIVMKFLNTYQISQSYKQQYKKSSLSHSPGENTFQQCNYTDETYPLLRHASPNIQYIVPSSMSPNIVLIMMESVAAKDTGFNEYIDLPGTNVTPFLNSMMAKSYVVTNFFSNGDYTAGAEVSTLSSIYDSLRYSIEKGSIFRNFSDTTVVSIANLLYTHKSYKTAFVQSYDIEFDNHDIILPKYGFSEIWGQESLMESEDELVEWGIKDELMLTRGAERLNAFEEPFFTFFLTVNNHAPYELPDENLRINLGNTVYEKYLNTVHYTDYALKQFFEYASKQDWYNNTIFIITSDNGSSLIYEKVSPIEKMMMGHRIPFMIFSPNEVVSKKLQQIDTTTIASHIDIAPTIAHLVGIDSDQPFIGESLFQADRSNTAILFEWFNHFYYVENNLVYSADTQSVFDMFTLEEQKTIHTQQMDKKLNAAIDTVNYCVLNDKVGE